MGGPGAMANGFFVVMNPCDYHQQAVAKGAYRAMVNTWVLPGSCNGDT